MSDNLAEFEKLIPELKEWNEEGEFSAEDWIQISGNYQLAIGYSLIFWPRFQRIDDYVVRAGVGIESIRSWEAATNGDARAVEAVLNHIHMVDIHVNEEAKTEEQLRYLGRTLRDIHELKLKADFPDLKFEVVFNDEDGLDPVDYELTFWRVRSEGGLMACPPASADRRPPGSNRAG